MKVVASVSVEVLALTSINLGRLRHRMLVALRVVPVAALHCRQHFFRLSTVLRLLASLCEMVKAEGLTLEEGLTRGSGLVLKVLDDVVVGLMVAYLLLLLPVVMRFGLLVGSRVLVVNVAQLTASLDQRHLDRVCLVTVVRTHLLL